MAKTVTVELSTEQVQMMLADARYLYPDETNAELEARVETAARYHGVYTIAETWRETRLRQQAQDVRNQDQASFDALFPPEATE